jgi:hypothetical protein
MVISTDATARGRTGGNRADTLERRSSKPRALHRPSLQASANGASLPEYATVNASIVQKFDLGIGQGTELRLDVLNIGDAVYEIRNGTEVGVGAPQFGIRRTILAGLTRRF